MINNQDQWKSEGKCDLCRRAPFCHNQCRAYKERGAQELSAAVGGAFLKAYERLIASQDSTQQ